MLKSLQRSEGIVRFLASKRLALWLFLALCLSLIPETFAEENFHISSLSRLIVGCMGLNLLLCTVWRISTLKKSVLVMHAGVLLTIAGAMASSLGFISTVNIYEGTTVNTAFLWSREQDVPLGFDLTVDRIEHEYYPVSVQVGVLKGDEKIGLFTLKTGQSFTLTGYTVLAERLDPQSENLHLGIYEGDRLIGRQDTDGVGDCPAGFPYRFKLAAYQDAVLRRAAVHLTISRDGAVIASGITEANGPFIWNGLFFYNTNLDLDEYGIPYAGIQIVKDPGRPVVFAGFIVLMAGALYWMHGKLRRRRS